MNLSRTLNPHVLIAYASRYGATQEIAEHMASVLSKKGLEVTLKAAQDIVRIRPYEAVVIGSPIYFDNWLDDAKELLESFQEQLAHKDVWLFSNGLNFESIGKKQLDHWLPESLKPLAAFIKPKQETFFAGKVNPGVLNSQDWLTNPGIRTLNDDYRDWSSIERWTEAISSKLS